MGDSRSTTFVVRLSQDEVGEASAIVELVRTGEKQRVQGVAAIGRAIEDMARRDRDSLDPGRTGWK